MMAAAPHSCSYGPCLASKDVQVAYCWEVVKIHCRHRSELAGVGPEEVYYWRLAELRPFPDKPAAGHRVFVLVALLESTAFESAAAAVGGLGSVS